MKMLHMTLIAAFAVALAALTIGCGGDDKPTLDEFIRKGYELDTQHEKTAVPLRNELDAALADLAAGDNLSGGVKDTLTKLFDEEDHFANQIEALDAPEAGKDIQKEAVASLRAEVIYGRKVVDSIRENTTFGDVSGAFENDEAVAIQTRRESACKSIQKLADDNNIDVDMSC